MADRIDVLLRFFDEHSTQARRHEDQRDRMTSLIMLVSGALVALISQSNFAIYSLSAALLTILLGLYGFVFARKHYERNQLHVQTVREVREEIDRELGVLPWPEKDGVRLPKRSLGALRDSADKRHYENFPQPPKSIQQQARSRIAQSRLHIYWEGLHIVVMIIGVVLGTSIYCMFQCQTTSQVQGGTTKTSPTER